MIGVRVYWNTDGDGNPVDVETMDWESEHAPVTYYGEFDSVEEAEVWMNSNPTLDDTDVYEAEAGDFQIPPGCFVAEPEEIEEEEDIRPEDPREIQGP